MAHDHDPLPPPARRRLPWRWLAALLALAGGAASAAPGQADAAAVIHRLDAIRQRLLEADRAAPRPPSPDGPAADPAPDADSAGETGQWFNWPNWANWSKWSKWNNWNNWGKQ